MMSTKKPFTIKQIIAGLDVSQDPLYINEGSSPYLQNCWIHEGCLKKGLAFKAFGTGLPLDAAVMLIDTFPLYTGAIQYLFVTALTAYKYSAAGVYSSIMNASTAVTILIGPTGWTNGSPGFDSLSSFGANITNAQNTAGTSETCASTPSMTLYYTGGVGKQYRITLWLTLSSGQAPTLTGTGGVTSTTLVNGRNDITFTSTGTACVLTLTNTAVSSWSTRGLGLYLVGGVGAFTGDLDNQFSAVPIIDAPRYENGSLTGGTDQFIITNGVDNMQKWDGGSSSKLTDLRGWSDNLLIAKQISYFNQMLVGTPISDNGTLNPKRVQWTAIGDVEDVYGPGSGFIDLVDSSDWCTAPFSIQGTLYIMKERSIWQMQFDAAKGTFTPVCVVDGIGCDTPNGIVNLGQEIMFYGNDNIYIFDGLNATPVGSKIYPWLYEAQKKIITGSFNNRCPGTYIEELKQFVLCLVPTDGQIPNQYFTYQLDNESWVLRTQEVTAFGFYTVPTSTSWSDLVYRWNDYIVTGATPGTFTVGETAKQGTSNATGIVSLAVGATGPLVMHTLTGTPNTTHTWVGQSSSAVFTPSPANAPVLNTWSSTPWMSLALPPGAPITLIGDSNGYIWQDDRLTYSTEYMCWESKDFMFDHAIRWTEFRLKAKNGAFQLSYSTDGGDTWSAASVFAKETEWTEYVMFVNFTSQTVRLKFECFDTDLWIEWIDLWYIDRMRSRVQKTSA